MRHYGSNIVEGLSKLAADLTLAGREKLKAKQFALKKKEVGKAGAEPAPGEAKGKYPIQDLPHGRNALARAKQQLKKGNLTQGAYDKIVARVYAKYPELKERREERGEAPLGEKEAHMNIKTATLVRTAVAAFHDEMAKLAAKPTHTLTMGPPTQVGNAGKALGEYMRTGKGVPTALKVPKKEVAAPDKAKP